MPNKLLHGALCLLAWASTAMAAEESALDGNGLFKRRAHAITELSTLELEKEVQDKQRELKPASSASGAGQGSAPTKTHLPVRLHEIGGSAGRLTATFRLSDGRLEDYVSGQYVPGFGTIKRIDPQAVEDAGGKIHTVEDTTE
jgi:type IV pilus biogenesis protein PilP